MRQLSLYESFRRHSTYPLVVAQIIHSYLPKTDALFLEQRLRFLLESGNLISDGSWYGNEGGHSFPDVDTLIPQLTVYNITVDRSPYRVALLRDQTLPDISFIRLSVSYDTGEVKTLRYDATPLKVHNVELEHEPDFSKLVLMLEKELNQINIETVGCTKSLFPGVTSFALLRTMRHDRKVVFHPTPTVRTLHLLL